MSTTTYAEPWRRIAAAFIAGGEDHILSDTEICAIAEIQRNDQRFSLLVWRAKQYLFDTQQRLLVRVRNEVGSGYRLSNQTNDTMDAAERAHRRAFNAARREAELLAVSDRQRMSDDQKSRHDRLMQRSGFFRAAMAAGEQKKLTD